MENQGLVNKNVNKDVGKGLLVENNSSNTVVFEVIGEIFKNALLFGVD